MSRTGGVALDAPFVRSSRGAAPCGARWGSHMRVRSLLFVLPVLAGTVVAAPAAAAPGTATVHVRDMNGSAFGVAGVATLNVCDTTTSTCVTYPVPATGDVTVATESAHAY